jgi:hypothetical protein
MKTYYLTSFWKYYSSLSSSVLFWFVLGAVAYQWKYLDFVFLTSMLGLADTALRFSSMPASRIVVSQKGIIWHSTGFTLWASWEDVQKISYRVYGFSLQEGLAVRKLSVQINNRGVGYLPTPWQIPPFKPFIPLSCFLDHWRDSELGDEIKQYAPHLFQ